MTVNQVSRSATGLMSSSTPHRPALQQTQPSRSDDASRTKAQNRPESDTLLTNWPRIFPGL